VGDFVTLIQTDKQQGLNVSAAPRLWSVVAGAGQARPGALRQRRQAHTAADLDAALFGGGGGSSSSISSSGEATTGSAGDGAVAVGLANLNGVLGLEYHVEYVRLLSMVAAAHRGGVKGELGRTLKRRAGKLAAAGFFTFHRQIRHDNLAVAGAFRGGGGGAVAAARAVANDVARPHG
jgi:hypothetical protein